MPNRDSSTAIVHDWIDSYGGAERLVETLVDETHPQAFFTLLANSSSELTKKLQPILKTSALQKLPFAFRFHRYLLSLYPRLIESFDLSEFETIISSSHCVAKGVLTRADQLHISYLHTPARYLWDLSHSYLKENQIQGLKRWYVEKTFHSLRQWDVSTHSRVDLFIANSQNVARRIWRCYRRPSLVLYPYVDLEKFKYEESRSESYFTVLSRLVGQKRVDIAVKACTQLNVPLKVIGDGPELKKLQSVAGKSIEFLGRLNDEEICKVIRPSAALIFNSEEDFGMVPIEAQALGVPVIAYGRGGALETVIENRTGAFYREQNPESLVKVLRSFRPEMFETSQLRSNAARFSKKIFLNEWNQIFSDARVYFRATASFNDDEFINIFNSSKRIPSVGREANPPLYS